ncbi:MAG: hypothetical protein AAFQ07_17875 [Chloroflexota bacterium]
MTPDAKASGYGLSGAKARWGWVAGTGSENGFGCLWMSPYAKASGYGLSGAEARERSLYLLHS